MPSFSQAVIGYRRRKPATARNNPLHPLARGKLLHYPFLSDVGLTVYDVVSGLAAVYHPRTQSSPPATLRQAGGLFGPSLNFRGGSGGTGYGSSIDVTNSSAYKPSSALTIAAWVNPDGVSTNYNVVAGIDYRNNGTWSAPNYSYALQSGWVGALTPYFHVTSGGTAVTITSPSGLATNAWSHIAGTYDGVTMRLYINGQQVTSTARSGAIDYGNNGPLAIGNISTRR